MKGQHDINLIGINWEKGSNTINYPSARKQVKVIGQYTAQFIDFMVIETRNDRCFSKVNISFSG